MSEKPITIVIPNYNGMPFIEKCLQSLQKQTFKEFNIVIVDNASDDGSREFIEQNYPQIKMICLDQNYGFSRAVNEGIRITDTEYIILLNNDTEAEEAFVENLYRTISKDSTLFSVAAKMLQLSKPDKIDGAGDLYCALGWAFALGKGRNKKHYNKEAYVFSACAGAAIYRRKIFEEIGYFDEFHFAYLEDVDVGYRAKIMGYRNKYTPNAVVYHVGSGFSGSRYNPFKIRLAARNSWYVIYKNMPFFQLLLNLPFLLLGFGIKAIFFIAKGYGREYLSGMKRGYLMCTQGKKYPYSGRLFKNYCKIQMELWLNLFRRILG
ncbi:MAG: glycosyltransferase family 2 protein [Clostridia bacterium]|nr:glycosyltransferase family 2 protein [Clostridia bacterium]